MKGPGSPLSWTPGNGPSPVSPNCQFCAPHLSLWNWLVKSVFHFELSQPRAPSFFLLGGEIKQLLPSVLSPPNSSLPPKNMADDLFLYSHHYCKEWDMQGCFLKSFSFWMSFRLREKEQKEHRASRESLHPAALVYHLRWPQHSDQNREIHADAILITVDLIRI